jgi:hypothetical protein
VSYIIGKLLERRCLKWVWMSHLSTQNTSYGQKKGRESNCQFDSQPLKVKNHPNFLAWRWHDTYRWKDLDVGHNFAWNLTSIGGFHTKLWASKVMGVPILGILGLPLGSPKTKWYLGVGLVARHIEYYKGEGDGFPQVWAMLTFVSLCLPMAHPCTKGVPVTH